LEGIVDGIYPPDEDHVVPVLEETYVLERLVEDLRLLTLAEARQLHFDLQPVQLGELAERAVDLFGAQAEEKHIDLSLTVDAATPTVQADPQRTGQVIGNLVSNALRYVPDGGHVRIGITSQGKGARVAVQDDGPGVPEPDLPRMFDRFWRGEKSRVRMAGGAGLGLAIARQLVEAQGGSIAASNVPSGGLEVAFVLPVT
jgi:signal transduction histidine kinase